MASTVRRLRITWWDKSGRYRKVDRLITAETDTDALHYLLLEVEPTELYTVRFSNPDTTGEVTP